MEEFAYSIIQYQSYYQKDPSSDEFFYDKIPHSFYETKIYAVWERKGLILIDNVESNYLLGEWIGTVTVKFKLTLLGRSVLDLYSL